MWNSSGSPDLTDFTKASIFHQNPAGVTQLVECQLPKLNVAGSSPVSRSSLIEISTRILILRNARSAFSGITSCHIRAVLTAL